MRASNIPSLFALVVLVSMAGCASSPIVTAIDGESYHVAAQGLPFDSQAGTNLRALVVASAYCNSRSKVLLFRHAQESGTHRFSAKREDMIFTCISAADPAYLNAKLPRNGNLSPDPIIAQQ